jgi:predicted DNA-binding transcriptional regulator YafY
LDEKMGIIKQAIADGKKLEITYLKSDDEKSRRIIKPYEVGEMFYSDKSFLGISAYCLKRKEDRVFRVDRILEMKAV